MLVVRGQECHENYIRRDATGCPWDNDGNRDTQIMSLFASTVEHVQDERTKRSTQYNRIVDNTPSLLP